LLFHTFVLKIAARGRGLLGCLKPWKTLEQPDARVSVALRADVLWYGFLGLPGIAARWSA